MTEGEYTDACEVIAVAATCSGCGKVGGHYPGCKTQMVQAQDAESFGTGPMVAWDEPVEAASLSENAGVKALVAIHKDLNRPHLEDILAKSTDSEPPWLEELKKRCSLETQQLLAHVHELRDMADNLVDDLRCVKAFPQHDPSGAIAEGEKLLTRQEPPEI